MSKATTKGTYRPSGETVQLLDPLGNEIAATTYVGMPSDLQQGLRITEINYHPHAPNETELAQDATLLREDFEFIELQNTLATPLDIDGAFFSNGIEFVFPDVTLAAGERLVLAQNPTAFAIRYDTPAVVTGPYLGNLRNSGETLKLDDPGGNTISEFAYDDGADWPQLADGKGASLELLSGSSDPTVTENWLGSQRIGGTPGSGRGPDLRSVVINEVSANENNGARWIELVNTSDEAVDIGGWLLSDDCNRYDKLQLPTPTVLAAGDYMVLAETTFNPGQGTQDTDLILDGNRGGELFLLSTDGQGQPINFQDTLAFGSAFANETWGRTPDGATLVARLDAATNGQANSLPQVGPIIISEIMYHPPDGDSGVAADRFEFVELQNVSSATVNIDGWQLTGGIQHNFASHDLAPGDFLVLVIFDPLADVELMTEFEQRYVVAPNALFIGPYMGNLSNGGEELALLQPGVPPEEEPDFTPQIVVDALSYSDAAPWPVSSDGQGESLTRNLPLELASIASSWRGNGPTPGYTDSAPTVIAVTLNGNFVDPQDLPIGSQLTSWSQQRSTLQRLEVTFDQPVDVRTGDIELINLGIDAPAEEDNHIPLTDQHLTSDGRVLRLEFSTNELPDGVYELRLLPSIENDQGLALDGDRDGLAGDSFVHRGNHENQLYALTADFNGDGGVSIFDFPIFSYWFGEPVGSAPDYADLNRDGGVTIFDFAAFSGNFGRSVRFPVAKSWAGRSTSSPHIATVSWREQLAALLQPLDIRSVNEDRLVGPWPILEKANRS